MKTIQVILYTIYIKVMDWVSEIGFFLGNFMAHLIICQSFAKTSCTIYFEKSSNMPNKLAKNEEKPCPTCPNPRPFLHGRHFQNPKSRFQVPDPSLIPRMLDLLINIFITSFPNLEVV